MRLYCILMVLIVLGSSPGHREILLRGFPRQLTFHTPPGVKGLMSCSPLSLRPRAGGTFSCWFTCECISICAVCWMPCVCANMHTCLFQGRVSTALLQFREGSGLTTFFNTDLDDVIQSIRMVCEARGWTCLLLHCVPHSFPSSGICVGNTSHWQLNTHICEHTHAHAHCALLCLCGSLQAASSTQNGLYLMTQGFYCAFYCLCWPLSSDTTHGLRAFLAVCAAVTYKHLSSPRER